MDIPFFFGAAGGGFVLMAAVGIQALVALFVSLPLARQRRRENPEFNLGRATRRIVMVTVIVAALVILITALVLHFATKPPLVGYLFGMVLAFVMSLKRLSRKNPQNLESFESSYADCYPQAAANPDDLANGDN